MNVLFVCTGNTCRSPMAEHLFRQLVKDAGLPPMLIQSAGVAPAIGMAFPKEAQEALRQEGVGPVQHQAKGLNEKMIEEADLILVMENHHKEALLSRFPKASIKTYLLKTYAGITGSESGIPDPIGQPLDVYVSTFHEVKTALQAIIAKIK